MIRLPCFQRFIAVCRFTTLLAPCLIFGISVSANAADVLPGTIHSPETPVIVAQKDNVWILKQKPYADGPDPTPEVTTVRMAQQFGLGYLPLMVVRQHQLIEKHAREARLGNLRVSWSRYPSGPAMHEALLLGMLDFAVGGVAPLVKIWDNTRGKQNVRGVATLETMPMYLNTVNPKVKGLADFTDQDRIALPAIKDSYQAVILQMAAAKAFGDSAYNRLDKMTVSMAHPLAMEALLKEPAGEITAHFTSPPFQYQELKDQRVHRVLDSYEVLGGPATFNLVWTRSQFYEDTPRTYAVVVAAIKEAISFIKQNPQAAAEVYLLQTGSPVAIKAIVDIINDPAVDYTTTPHAVMKIATFMHKTGAIKSLPGNWQDLFFPNLHNEPGS